MADSTEGRISAVESDVRNISKGIDSIRDYLYRTTDNHTKVMERLAVIESNQINFKDYVTECDADRNKHESRISKVEWFQGNQMKIAAFLAVCVSFIINGSIEFFKK